MAHSQSAIANHPQKQAIIDAMLSGKSNRAVAAMADPPISPAAVQRFRQVLSLNSSISLATVGSATTCTSKAWVEREYVDIVTQAKRKKDYAIARSALDSLVNLNGYAAPKRTESLTLNLHALGSTQLTEHLAAAIHSLPANERAALTQAEPVIAECEDIPQS